MSTRYTLSTDPIDINEDELLRVSPTLLNTLLIDRTLSTPERQVNIFWATDNYAERGVGYQYNDPITIEAITGDNSRVIVPRAIKSRDKQRKRSREMAEVFTPSWVCNDMANMLDEVTFGRVGVFNTAMIAPDGTHYWIDNPDRIVFPKTLSWSDYISNNVMEITCGEAPFLVSRYDSVSGRSIPLRHRIGLLDRKLRIVGENTSTYTDWINATRKAFQSTYGYEWQGDNLLLAREALLFTFLDYYKDRFGYEPDIDLLLEFAEIISWNLWQMDGLRGVIPGSCVKIPKPSKNNETSGEKLPSLFHFSDLKETVTEKNTTKQQIEMVECPACRAGYKSLHGHTGKYCIIKNWKEDVTLKYINLVNEQNSEL